MGLSDVIIVEASYRMVAIIEFQDDGCVSHGLELFDDVARRGLSGQYVRFAVKHEWREERPIDICFVLPTLDV